MAGSLRIAGRTIAPGTRQTVELPLPPLFVSTPLALRVHVIRGRRDGPRLFVSAAIHGDELNGVEIIRRLLRRRSLARLRGTLIAVPMVNVYGVLHHSRYLPDRRDLNRTFPGHERGSMAARLADLFMNEVVERCTHGIDLHTAALHRTNLPHIRADLAEPETNRLARAFGVPVLLNSSVRDGSLREAAREAGVHVLLYEAGQALRFDELAIQAGVHGVLNVMRALEMLPDRRATRPRAEPFVARSTAWVRAPASGIFRNEVRLGAHVPAKARIGVISDPLDDAETPVLARFTGVIIGHTRLPLVYEGEALHHVARFEDSAEVADRVEAFRSGHEPDLAGPPGSPDPDRAGP